jgi:hypothetical protein
VGRGERALSVPQPGQQDDEPGTEHGGEATSSRFSFLRPWKFKSRQPGFGYVQLDHADPQTDHDPDNQPDYGYDYHGGSST